MRVVACHAKVQDELVCRNSPSVDSPSLKDSQRLRLLLLRLDFRVLDATAVIVRFSGDVFLPSLSRSPAGDVSPGSLVSCLSSSVVPRRVVGSEMEAEETEVRGRNEVSRMTGEVLCSLCGCWTRVAVEEDEEDSFSSPPGDAGDLIDVLIHWD